MNNISCHQGQFAGKRVDVDAPLQGLQPHTKRLLPVFLVKPVDLDGNAEGGRPQVFSCGSRAVSQSFRWFVGRLTLSPMVGGYKWLQHPRPLAMTSSGWFSSSNWCRRCTRQTDTAGSRAMRTLRKRMARGCVGAKTKPAQLGGTLRLTFSRGGLEK